MSQWTQVAGAIRIDSFGINQNEIPKILEKALGKQITFENWEKPDGDCTPTGSEGGITYRYVSNNETNSMNVGTIILQGSLRDYGGDDDINGYFHGNTHYKEILHWLNNTLKRLPKGVFIGIRQGIIEVNVESHKTDSYIIKYDSNSNQFIELKIKQ